MTANINTTIEISSFYHAETGTWSYLVIDSATAQCAIIDPVLDFDLSSGVASYQSSQQLIDCVTEKKLELQWILETHAHADHLTAAQYVKQQLGGKIVIGAGIKDVQHHFSEALNLEIALDGSQFDQLVDANDKLTLGQSEFIVHPTPGHTDDSVSYQIGDNLFIGDTFFHPNLGTARCDFPGGSAKKLFKSLKFLTSFPDNFKLWLCHDYPKDREAIACTTVAQQKNNVHLLGDSRTYVNIRNTRDSGLNVPRLIYPSIQVNICAGHFPTDDTNGRKYLKLPFSVL